MAYTPRPGSIGERSIAYLREHGKTLGHDLADAIDAERSAIYASLNLCVENALLVRGNTPGKGMWYALPGDEADREPPKFSAAVADNLPPVLAGNAVIEEPIAEIEIPHFFQRSPLVEKAMNAGPREGSGIRVSGGGGSPRSRHFELGLFTDGRMVIEVDGDAATLDRDETERLFDWVRKVDSFGGLA